MNPHVQDWPSLNGQIPTQLIQWERQQIFLPSQWATTIPASWFSALVISCKNSLRNPLPNSASKLFYHNAIAPKMTRTIDLLTDEPALR